jgi:hypothetical protein
MLFRVGLSVQQEGGPTARRLDAHAAAQEKRRARMGDEGKAAGSVPLAALLSEFQLFVLAGPLPISRPQM